MGFSSGILILLALAVVALPALALRRLSGGFTLVRIRRELEESEILTPAGLGEGPAQVRGRARAGETIRGPVSGEPLIAYRLVVEQVDGASAWPLYEESAAADFELEDPDDGAVVQIEAGDAQLLLSERLGQGPGLRVLPESIQKGLLSHCQYIPSAEGVTRLRWREHQLRGGDQVVVQGEAALVAATQGRARPGGDPYRAIPVVPVLRPGARRPLVVLSDKATELLRAATVLDGEIEQIVPRGLA